MASSYIIQKDKIENARVSALTKARDIDQLIQTMEGEVEYLKALRTQHLRDAADSGEMSLSDGTRIRITNPDGVVYAPSEVKVARAGILDALLEYQRQALAVKLTRKALTDYARDVLGLSAKNASSWVDDLSDEERVDPTFALIRPKEEGQ